ncbi:hypothetical protein D3C85_1318950 [compost metagenome]
MHRPFIGLAADFVIGRAHGEGAGRQNDHFRAVLAVLEYLARWRGRGGAGGNGEQAGHEGGQGDGLERQGQQISVHESSRSKKNG